LGRVGLSHFAVIPASPDSPSDHRTGGSEPGFDVRLVDKQLVVSSVERDGGAAAAGVRAGWVVDRIDGTPVATLLTGIADGAPSRMAQLEAWRLAVTRLRGSSGSKVEVEFLDGSGAKIVKAIERHPEQGTPVTVGSLPTMYVRVSSELESTPGG